MMLICCKLDGHLYSNGETRALLEPEEQQSDVASRFVGLVMLVVSE